MKTITPNNNLRGRILPVAMALLVIFSLGACSKKVVFPVSSVVPAAKGMVKVKQDKNDNYTIEVNVEHLADPERLNPPKDVYVVWVETEQDGIRNIGQLKSSRSLFSKTLKGSLEAITPFKPSEVFITAEDNSNVQYPTMQVVLRTESFKVK